MKREIRPNLNNRKLSRERLDVLRYCSDCTILISFSGHGPVMVLFLSSHSFGTIITYPYICTERLLLIRTFIRNDYCLSVHLYGTIIANPHIRTERLLLILTFIRNDYYLSSHSGHIKRFISADNHRY